MRILLDEHIPMPLMNEFVGNECSHVISLDWEGTENGDLLSRADQARFEVPTTFDEDIPVENDVSSKQIAVFVVEPEGRGLRATRPLLPEILFALKDCAHGNVKTFTNRTRMRSD